MDAIEFIENVTRNCDAVQERVLAEILGRNAETEYLKRHRLEGRTDRQSFKSRIPIVTYEDILPEIHRIANGDFSPILSADPVTEFMTSSGTSRGEEKLIPSVKDDMGRKLEIIGLTEPIISLHVPEVTRGKVLSFHFTRAEKTTPGGLVARNVSTHLYKSDHFRSRQFDPHNQFISPVESVLCLDTFQSMYTQMLAGLYERLGVLRVGAVFASGLLRVIRFLRLHYPELCQDIATGTLSPKITDPSVIRAMSEIMRPDPDLARTIEKECSKENWEGIIKRVWPNAKYLEVIVTGAMAQYIPTLDYYSGGLPKVSLLYSSSEAFFGVNLKPMADPSKVAYTIMPNVAYFEFIPLDSSGSSNSTSLVDLAKVEVGKEYELVVTTYAGLYRYRVGDVLLVTGFHNAAPQFCFVRRENVLSIDIDKTDEADLQRAIDKASALLHSDSHTTILDYTTYADTNTILGHYVVYLELMQQNEPAHRPDNDLLTKCCLEMEESLNSIYRECRVIGLVGPLEIRIVGPGTFEELMDYAISKGASIGQYKTPRCVNSLSMVKLLDSRVVSAHFSPSTPRWSPTAGENK